MNIVKRFFLNSNGHTSSDKSVLLSSGRLFLVRSPLSPKSENECLYNDAILSIRDTTNPFNYQLVVSKAVSEKDQYSDDADEEGEGGDDELDDELFDDSSTFKTFLIDEELKLCCFQTDHGTKDVIAWRDLEGDIGDMYEYRISSEVTQDTIDSFMLAVYKCAYERKYKKSSAPATVSDLQEFVVSKEEMREDGLLDSIPSSRASSLRHLAGAYVPSSVPGSVAIGASSSNATINSSSGSSRASAGNAARNDAYTEADDEFEDAEEGDSDPRNGKPLGAGSQGCKLFVYDSAKGAFKPKLSDECTVKVLDLGNWDYWIEVDNGRSEPVVGTNVIEQLDPVFQFDQLCFVFNYLTEEDASTYLCKFDDREAYEEFQRQFATAMWEHKNQARYVALKSYSESYITDAYNNASPDSDVDMSDIYEDTPDDDEDISERRVSLSRSVSHLDEDSVDYDPTRARFKGNEEKNSGLKISAKNDRAFVSRGDKIGVFSTGANDDDLEFQTAIENIRSSKTRKRIDPGNVMLQKGDTVMIMQDKENPDKLYKMDLNRGQIVEDWTMSRDDVELPVVGFTGNDKYAEMGNDETFLGVSKQAIFQVDPRLREKIVDSQFKQYKTKTGFTQIATTEDGNIAASTRSGEIKLYNKLGKAAKTALPGLGDDFIGLTTSNDGRFLLATCNTYLLLIDVKIKRGKNRYKLGFEKSFGADDKPLPKKLTIRPEHLAYIRQTCGKNVSFTKANFNTSLSSKSANPTSIITSVGPFAITWNLRKVLRNDQEPYTIRRYNDTVMMGDFTAHNRHRMVLTLPDDVTLVSSRSFRKPLDEFQVVKEYGQQ